MKFNIIINNNVQSKKIKNSLLKLLKNHQYTTKQYEYLFIVGGDGFFLSEFNKVHDKEVKVIFINAGTLGFYAFSRDVKKIKLDTILNEKNYHTLDMLEVQIKDKIYYCANDFSFQNNHTTNIDLKINHIYMEEIFCNGFLISTNFGSTARNKSLGGPIVFPNISAMIFNEVEPIHNKFNTSLKSPLVLNPKTVIDLNIKNRAKDNGWFLFDGLQITNNHNKINIKVQMCKSTAKVLLCLSIAAYAKKLNYAFIEKEVKNGNKKNIN